MNLVTVCLTTTHSQTWELSVREMLVTGRGSINLLATARGQIGRLGFVASAPLIIGVSYIILSNRTFSSTAQKRTVWRLQLYGAVLEGGSNTLIKGAVIIFLTHVSCSFPFFIISLLSLYFIWIYINLHWDPTIYTMIRKNAKVSVYNYGSAS